MSRTVSERVQVWCFPLSTYSCLLIVSVMCTHWSIYSVGGLDAAVHTFIYECNETFLRADCRLHIPVSFGLSWGKLPQFRFCLLKKCDMWACTLLTPMNLREAQENWSLFARLITGVTITNGHSFLGEEISIGIPRFLTTVHGKKECFLLECRIALNKRTLFCNEHSFITCAAAVARPKRSYGAELSFVVCLFREAVEKHKGLCR